MNWRRRFSLVTALWLLWLCAMPVFSSATYDGSARFNDVSPESPYNEAIGWAVERDITDGATPNTFNPKGKCTVQAILKFLWAYHGRPNYPGDIYVDVTKTFQDAANWANLKGYETGQQAGDGRRLNGGEFCTRLRVVRYLWLIAGRPEGHRDKAEQFHDLGHDSTFPDEDAVGWAVEKGITKGTTETTFSPESACTRGQIATFLYRYEINVNHD